jgi:hypothetical protein
MQFRQWVTTLLHIAGVKPGRLSIPRGVAWTVAGLMESIWKITRRRDAPPITRTMVRLFNAIPATDCTEQSKLKVFQLL